LGGLKLLQPEWTVSRREMRSKLAVLRQHTQTDALNDDLAVFKLRGQEFAIARHGLRSY
jgi:hypothetical protein